MLTTARVSASYTRPTMIAILGPLHGWGTVILVTFLIALVVLLLMHWLGPPGRRRE